MKWVPQSWNDTLSLLLIVGVPLLWVFGNLAESYQGATIVVWTLVAQFYYRKRLDEDTPAPGR